MAKFGLPTKFLNPLRQFMNEAYKKTLKNTSGYNKLCSLNMVEIVTGDYPDFKIDYHKVVVTKGSLIPPRDATVACARPGKLVFTWNESIGHPYELTTDRVFVIIYDEEIKSWKIFESAATREDGKCRIWLEEKSSIMIPSRRRPQVYRIERIQVIGSAGDINHSINNIRCPIEEDGFCFPLQIAGVPDTSDLATKTIDGSVFR